MTLKVNDNHYGRLSFLVILPQQMLFFVFLALQIQMSG